MGNVLLKAFYYLVFLVFSFYKSNHYLLFSAIFPNLEMLQFWSVNYICQVRKLYFIADITKLLDNIYI